MKGKIYKKGLAVLLGLTLAANLPVTSPLSIHMLDSYAYTGAATVKASSLNVRSDAGTGYSAVAVWQQEPASRSQEKKRELMERPGTGSSTQAVTVRQVQVMYPPLT